MCLCEQVVWNHFIDMDKRHVLFTFVLWIISVSLCICGLNICSLCLCEKVVWYHFVNEDKSHDIILFVQTTSVSFSICGLKICK